MRGFIPPLVLLLAACRLPAAEVPSLTSPDGRLVVEVRLADRIYYNLVVDGREVMRHSPLALLTDRGELGVRPRLRSAKIIEHDGKITPPWGLRREIRDRYRELQLECEGGYTVLFRAYDEGIAYRFRTALPGPLVVRAEEVEYRFAEDFPLLNHVVDDFQTSYEKHYTRQPISAVKPENLVSLPALVRQPGLTLAILESDLHSYPGLYLGKVGNHNRPTLAGRLPGYPTAWEQGGWGRFNLRVTARADHLARTEGARDFPWRVLQVARADTELLDSDLVYKLARPPAIETGWVRPGKVAWDWWSALNFPGVDFRTGVNTRSYEHLIDFAARHGLPYVMLDEGWSDQFDLNLPSRDVDLPHLVRYARERGVRLILWAVWHTVDRQHEEVFPRLAELGIAGVKIDFIDRDDQLAVEYYERIARAAAAHRLLVDYHGCSKPTGLHRTYPNVVNFEAVLGNEYNKFSAGTPPGHNVDVAFTRMLAGPLDYTPGAMTNSAAGDFRQSFNNPMSHGTRMHQLGMFVVYQAPLQMLCDTPAAYEAHPDVMAFLAAVPTTWDDTVALAGQLGEYAVIARRSGRDWFIGGLNNWTAREVTLDLRRLGAGEFDALLLRDGENADRQAGDYRVERRVLGTADPLTVRLQPGGGFALWLRAR